MALPTYPHTALTSSLIGSTPPNPPPAHLKVLQPKNFSPSFPDPGINRRLRRERRPLVFPHRTKAQRAPLLRPPSKGGFRICPAFLFGPQLPSCVPQGHNVPQPSPLPQASLRGPQSSGFSKLSVKKRVGSAISLRSMSSAIFTPAPHNHETVPKARLSPSPTNQLTL